MRRSGFGDDQKDGYLERGTHGKLCTHRNLETYRIIYYMDLMFVLVMIPFAVMFQCFSHLFTSLSLRFILTNAITFCFFWLWMAFQQLKGSHYLMGFREALQVVAKRVLQVHTMLS